MRGGGGAQVLRVGIRVLDAGGQFTLLGFECLDARRQLLQFAALLVAQFLASSALRGAPVGSRRDDTGSGRWRRAARDISTSTCNRRIYLGVRIFGFDCSWNSS